MQYLDDFEKLRVKHISPEVRRKYEHNQILYRGFFSPFLIRDESFLLRKKELKVYASQVSSTIIPVALTSEE